MTLFLIIYFGLLCCYFFTRVGNNKTYRTVNKYLLALMYFSLAIYIFVTTTNLRGYHLLFMVGLLFLFLGDIILGFSFSKGGACFLCGNIIFTVYELLVLTRHGYGLNRFYWIFILVPLLIGLFTLACEIKPELFNFGKMRWLITIYLLSILMHGITGFALMTIMKNTTFQLLGTGSFLYMISDIVLIANKFMFNENKWLTRLNSLTYFSGIICMVLAMFIY